MNTEELESLLQAAEESQTLEFKSAMNWDATSLAKDILAMSNLQDGGRIIIGIEDQTYIRQGLTQEQLATYDIESMRDQISPFADPYVEFSMDKVSDKCGRMFVAIAVSSFDEIPVICKKDGKDVNRGCIYYRSLERRPQSARISNSNDLRDLLERAAVKLMQRMKRIGLVVESAIDDALDSELEGL